MLPFLEKEMPATAVNKQPYDTRFFERELLSSFNAVCSVLVMSYYRSQTALRKAAHVSCSLRAVGKMNIGDFNNL